MKRIREENTYLRSKLRKAEEEAVDEKVTLNSVKAENERLQKQVRTCISVYLGFIMPKGYNVEPMIFQFQSLFFYPSFFFFFGDGGVEYQGPPNLTVKS